MTIQDDLVRCIQDTERCISRQAANTLRPWQDYPVNELISSIRRAIRISHNQQNGWEIHRNNGVSLEMIVLNHNDFSNEDKHIARQTLGL